MVGLPAPRANPRTRDRKQWLSLEEYRQRIGMNTWELTTGLLGKYDGDDRSNSPGSFLKQYPPKQ